MKKILFGILSLSIAIVSCGKTKHEAATHCEQIVIGPEPEAIQEPMKWHKRW